MGFVSAFPGSVSDLCFTSSRSASYSTAGMVASSQPLATMAGVRMLERGGSAADAIVACAAALAVLEPCSTGVGGDGFALYRTSQGELDALNGSGRSSARMTLDAVLQACPDPQATHPSTITVPGVVASWFDLLEKHGTMDPADVLAPALSLARDGAVVGPVTSELWARGQQLLQNAPGGEQLLVVNGRTPLPGEYFTNPGMARTLEILSREHARGFYQGEIAQRIEDVVQNAGGFVGQDDLAAHSSLWAAPIGVEYHGVQVYECPPNSDGMVALVALNILSRLDELDTWTNVPGTVEHVHAMVEALKLGFADAGQYVADPETAPVPDMLSREYATQRAGLLAPEMALSSYGPGRPAGSDTVQLCAADRYGNMCSMVNSVYQNFGTGIGPRGLGFTLQNRGLGFSRIPGHPNVVGPSKRCFHTIIPAMAVYPDGCCTAFGVMGGYMQPQGHVQVLSHMVDAGLDPQAALDRPRFCLEPDPGKVLGTAMPGMGLAVESSMDPAVVEGLRRRGHNLRVVSGFGRSLFGRGQIIVRNPQGVLCGGSDGRADGCAVGVLGQV